MRSNIVHRAGVTTVDWLRRRPGTVIFVLALAARLSWISTLDDTLTWPDEHDFAAIARHIVRGDGYVSQSYRANPVIPFYLAAVMQAFGENYFVARFGQAVAGAATCVLVQRLGARLVAPLVGLLAGLALSVYPSHVYLTGVFYVACFVTFFSTLTLWLGDEVRRRGYRPAWAFVCGLALGVTVLTRANFVLLLPCLWLGWLYAARGSRRRSAIACVALLLGATTIVAPWTLRNYRVYGTFVLVSSGSGETLWKGNNVVSDGGPDDRNLTLTSDSFRERVAELDPAVREEVVTEYDEINRRVDELRAETADLSLARDAVLQDVAVRYMMENPRRTLELFAKKVVTLYSAFSDTESENRDTSWWKKLVAALSYYPVLALALVGFVLGLARRRELAPIYLFVAATTASYGLLTACTRFRVPIDPLLILFAAITAARIAAALSPAMALYPHRSRSAG